MFSEQEIKERLRNIGFRDAEIPDIMRDVGAVIIGKVLIVYVKEHPHVITKELLSMEPDALRQHLSEEAGAIPRLSQQQFDTICDETWQDYFNSVHKAH